MTAPAIDWTKDVETMDGRKVRILCTDAPGPWPVRWMNEEGYVFWAGADGVTRGCDGAWCLRNVPEPPSVSYLNIYKDPRGTRYVGGAYETRREADASNNPNRIGCNRIVLEEGRYDD